MICALAAMALVSTASARTLSGNISDASGNTRTGANVVIEGINLGG